MPFYVDQTIWSPDEVALRDAVNKLFQGNYSRDEIRFLVDKSLLHMMLCEWKLNDSEVQEILKICKPNYIKIRDSMGFTRQNYYTAKNKESANTLAMKHKLLMLENSQRRLELAQMRKNIEGQMKNKGTENEDSLPVHETEENSEV